MQVKSHALGPNLMGLKRLKPPPKHAWQVFLYIGFPDLTELKILPAKLWKEFYLKSWIFLGMQKTTNGKH